jgi:citrate lyase synthetase
MNVEDIQSVIDHVTNVSLASSHLDHPNIGAWLEGEYNPADVLAKLDSSICLIVRDNEHIVGTGFIDTTTGYISGVYVSNKGHGTGRLIVDRLLEEAAAEAGTKHFTASVHPDSKAMQHILSTSGFTATHVDPHVVYYVGTDFMIWEKSV